MFTQVHDWVEGQPVYLQHHEPLAILSGSFHGSELLWRINEKEAYPIILALTEWEDMLRMNPKGFRIYSDHKNLVDIFRPESANPPFARSALQRIYNWLYLVASFKVEAFEHLEGEHNKWGDMVSRWANPDTYSTETNTQHVAVTRKRRLPIRERQHDMIEM